MRRSGSPSRVDPTSEQLRRKKRRYLSRSDEEILDEMDTKSLWYRKGWPELLPLPLTTMRDGAQNAVENVVARIQTIATILHAQQIHFHEINFVYRVPDLATAPISFAPYHTVLITKDMTVPGTEIIAITQIRQHLKKYSETEDIIIEMIDYRVTDGLLSRPIHYTDRLIIESWPRMLRLTTDVLKQHNARWSVIELLHRGVLDEVGCMQPTIVITSSTADEESWYSTTLPTLKKALLEENCPFIVEILYKESIKSHWSHASGENVFPEMYKHQVAMGTSIGVQGDRSSGTLGGFVVLKDGKKYALTNYHVIRDEQICPILPSPSIGVLLPPGNPLLLSNPQRIVTPSDKDHAGYIAKLEREVKAWQAQEKYGDKNATQQIAATRAQIANVQGAQRCIGTLYCASGRRTVTAQVYGTLPEGAGSVTSEGVMFPLDWSLIEMNTVRASRNEMQPISPRPSKFSTNILRQQFCNTWTKLDTGKTSLKAQELKVAKFGRTTHWTFGTLNCVVCAINPDVMSKANIDKYGWTVDEYGYAYTIDSNSKASSFSREGDSGSIVILDAPPPLRSGAWLGLTFATTAAGSTLMMPIDHVFDDIEKITGQAVVEPSFITV